MTIPACSPAHLELGDLSMLFTSSQSSSLEEISFAEPTDVGRCIGQIIAVLPHTYECRHRLPSIGGRASVTIAHRLTHSVGNGSTPLPRSDVQRLLDVVL